MPELRVHKRRPFPRLPIKCSPSLITEMEVARKKKHQTIATSLMVMLFLFCSVNGYWIVADIQKNERAARTKQARKTNKSNNASLKKPKKTRWSLGSFFSSSTSHISEAETTLSPEKIKKMEDSIYSIVKMLPEFSKTKTDKSNYSDRYQLFKTFYNSLSKGDQKALFPIVTLEKMEEFYREDVAGASKLLDRLLKSVQMLIP